MAVKTRKLTKKQKFFVAEYPKDFNGARAAVDAGFSPKTAREIAYQLLHKTSHVMEAIQRDEDERLRKIGVHSERILAEVARVGLSDLRKLYNEDGSLKLPHEWSDEAAAAVAGVEVSEIFAGEGKDRALIGHTKKVRSFDKIKALELLSKHLGLIGNGKHRDEDDDGNIVKVMTPLELSAKMYFYLELVMRRSKEIEGKKDGKI